MMNRLLKTLLLVSLSLALVVACSPAPPPGPVEPPPPSAETPTLEGEGILKLPVGRVLQTLNPHQQGAGTTRRFLDLIQGKLYRFYPGPDGVGFVTVDELADGMPIQMDSEGKVWQVKVKEGMVWTNGEPLTGADFVYSWKMCVDPLLLNHRVGSMAGPTVQVKNVAKYSAGELEWEEVGIKLLDPLTIELTLDAGITEFELTNALNKLWWTPVYEPLYEAGMNAERTQTNYGTSVDKAVYSGPFMATDWQPGAEYTAMKNPLFVNQEEIWLAGINWRVLLEAGTAMQLFERGELDFVQLTEADYLRYREDPRVVEIPGRSIMRIPINLVSAEKPILGDIRFRQALFYATDRVTAAALANGDPANYQIPHTHIIDVKTGEKYRDQPEAQAILTPNYGYDPVKAKELFDAAMADAGLQELSLQLQYHEGNEARRSVSEFLQKSWNELFDGKLTLTLQATPANQLFISLSGYKDDPNAFELAWTSTGYDDFAPESAIYHFVSSNPNAKGPYLSDEYDAIWDELSQVPLSDVSRRLELIVKAEAMLLFDAHAIPVDQAKSFVLVSDRVELKTDGWNVATDYGWKWHRLP